MPGRTLVTLAMLLLAAAILQPPHASAAPLSWSGPLVQDRDGVGNPLAAIACVSASSCLAFDGGGGEVSFDPGSPSPSEPAAFDATGAVTAVTCLSSSSCIAVDSAGYELAFDPSDPTGAKATAVDPGHSLVAVGCTPDGTLCLAVDGRGYSVTFAPTEPKQATVLNSQLTETTAVACVSDTDCLVTLYGGYATINPTTKSTTGESTMDNGQYVTAITCANLTGACLMFDSYGGEFTIQTDGSGYTEVHLDTGQSIAAATCATASKCVALTAAGGLLSFSPGETASEPATQLPDGGGYDALACPSASVCVAVDGDGQTVAFDPSSIGSPEAVLIDGMPSYAALACASITQCAAIDVSGDEIGFDPQTQQPSSAEAVDADGQGVTGLACPSVSRCTLTDLDGEAITFDPATGTTVGQAVDDSSNSLLALSCPAVHRCVTADSGGYELTFDPATATLTGEHSLPHRAGAQLVALSCPTSARCTSLDSYGEVVSFDPAAPASLTAAQLSIGAGADLSCPSLGECVALSPAGKRVTFSPQDPGAARATTLLHSASTGLACPLVSYCVAVGAGGQAAQFDPRARGTTAVRAAVAGDATPTAIACVSSALCELADSTGSVFAGSSVLPPLPKALRAPALNGVHRAGRVLRITTPGIWAVAPTSTLWQWQRCDRRGGDCVAIAGATGASHRLSFADVGHRLRLGFEPANQAGAGRLRRTAASALVTGRAPALVVSRATLSGVALGHPVLALTLVASRPSRRFIVRPPAGLRLTLDSAAKRRAISVLDGHGGLSVRVQARSATKLILAARRRIRSLRLTVTSPALTVSGALVQDALTGASPGLRITVTATVARHAQSLAAARLTIPAWIGA